MKRASAVLRHYLIADDAMRQNMRTMQQHFADDQKAFAAFNLEFTAPYDKQWLTAIDAADTAPDGTVRVGELKEDTAAVNDVMTQAQAAVQQVFYFVGRAFPHNAGRMAQYGRGDYTAARDNHDKMRTLLTTAFASATRDQAALAAKGYGATQLAALGKLADQLTDTNTTQEVKKGSNTEDSDAYVTTQNLAYGFGQEVSAAAKVLFATDAAKLALFRLGSGSRPSGLEHHEVTVRPGKQKVITFTTPLLAATRLHLHLAVPQAGNQATLGRVAAAPDAPTLTLALTSQVPDQDAAAPDLGPAGQLLVVRNTGTGSVRVEVTLLG